MSIGIVRLGHIVTTPATYDDDGNVVDEAVCQPTTMSMSVDGDPDPFGMLSCGWLAVFTPSVHPLPTPSTSPKPKSCTQSFRTIDED